LKLFLDFWTYFPEAATTVLHAFRVDDNWSQLLLLMEQGENNKVNGNFTESDMLSIGEQWRKDVGGLKYWQKKEKRIRLQSSSKFNSTTPTNIARAYNQNTKIIQRWTKFLFPNYKKSARHLKNEHLHVTRKTYLYAVSSNSSSHTDDKESAITLPVRGRVDDHLIKSSATLRESCRNFLIKPVRSFTKESPERLVYIHQGEVGHTLFSHCDIILSDMATTCHILALQSESSSGTPMTTLAHIDGTFYDDCVHNMVTAHLYHHERCSSQEKRSEQLRNTEEIVRMEIHVVGGFDDERSLSVKISSWLMHLLAAIAARYKDVLKICIKTCAISSINDNGNASPIGRGMGIDVRTGEAFLAKVDMAVAGPAQQLRMAHVWAGRDTLSVVKTTASERICIEPFMYDVFPNLNLYLKLPDHRMIKRTSTSPDVEESNFCSDVRKTLRFIREIDCTRVFGPSVDHPLIFARVSNNSWKRVN